MSNRIEISEIQRDGLKEIANVGTGSASKYLSDILDTEVDLEVPEAEILKIDVEEFKDAYDIESKKLSSVFMDVEGANASVVIIFEEEDYREFLGKLRNSEGSEEEKNFLTVSEKLGEHYLEGVEKLLDIELNSSEAKLITAEWKSSIVHLRSELNLEEGSEVLSISTKMNIKGTDSLVISLMDSEEAERMSEKIKEKI